ncbi:MAG TPA: iron-only hydrogenase system regulator [Candidatus Omnitrophota bacterium]|nr:iron-only hydrogenase system regulator [Candidatus Omnitrophota bacterium]MDD5736920.1 iron-only hydrogenase system regulator [Candidatus Omnitrophota bacterium]HOX09840.1 iron-only hydrogenase system regulator [Candidatus Omnitrophota bacterium]HPN66129.1 iron-only hydrogenase system regulator [Candidatus Omnitrophota bacterium]HRZ66903.1 iron-only hydrogenase system regulator [Candidatus Omnitrophota bacterium]
MDKRIGFMGIIITDRKNQAAEVNKVLSEFGSIIQGRMGIPYKERNCSVITIIVDATTDDIGALTGRLGLIKGVSVKSALSKGK